MQYAAIKNKIECIFLNYIEIHGILEYFKL